MNIRTSKPVSDQLLFAAYSNGGDSRQIFVTPCDGGFLVVEASASHGYASLPTAQRVEQLSDITAAMEEVIKDTYMHRDPEVTISGSGMFEDVATDLKAHQGEVAASA